MTPPFLALKPAGSPVRPIPITIHLHGKRHDGRRRREQEREGVTASIPLHRRPTAWERLPECLPLGTLLFRGMRRCCLLHLLCSGSCDRDNASGSGCH